jgi:hypothetical protein
LLEKWNIKIKVCRFSFKIFNRNVN